MACPEEKRIKVAVSNGVPYIWTTEDWYTLRVEHHVVGKFDGAAPPWDIPGKFPMLNCMQMSLPLRLSNEEILYLLKHGLAKTYEVPKMNAPQPPVDLERYQSFHASLQDALVERYKLKRRAEIEGRVDEIIEGKRRKGRETPDKEKLISNELSKIKNIPGLWTSLQLKDPWGPVDQTYAPFEFPLPSTVLDKTRFRVYDDFTFNRKYYITNGMKFGGDFLAYPGDPMNHHAEYIIICEVIDQKLSRSQIIAQARLASIVKKTFLIAFIDTATDMLKYKPVTAPYLDMDSSQL